MKLHKGTIQHWRRVDYGDTGYLYTGKSEGHPEFDGRIFHTSMVVREIGNEVETLNSFYTLGEPAAIQTDAQLPSMWNHAYIHI